MKDFSQVEIHCNCMCSGNCKVFQAHFDLFAAPRSSYSDFLSFLCVLDHKFSGSRNAVKLVDSLLELVF